MRAAYYESTGSARDVLKLAEIDDPQPADGEVLVEVAYSGVNPSDVRARGGGSKRPFNFARTVPHSDGAGTIVAVGAGVSKERIGERVWLWNGQWFRPFGTAAERVALPSVQAVTLPAGISLEEGACLGIPALTAWYGLHHMPDMADHTILVVGGAGSVARYAIEMAKSRGARVLTTTSVAEKTKYALDAGADMALDYRAPDFAERVLAETSDQGLDYCLESNLAGNAALLPTIMAKYGTVVIYGTGGPEATIPSNAIMQKNIRMQFVFVYEIPDAERPSALSGINGLLEQGAITKPKTVTFDLDQIVEAHEAVENGSRFGQVLVRIGGEAAP
jgi:NADPH2:quinone reductase